MAVLAGERDEGDPDPARDKGAEYFLTPSENCSEAVRGTPSGLRLVKVDTLDGAMKSLDLIRSGQAAALPSCPR